METDHIADEQVITANITWICEALDEIAGHIVLPGNQVVNINQEGHPWRKWFLSQALIEVRKVIAALMVFKDPNSINICHEQIDRNSLMVRMHYDLAAGQTRKLKEILARLVLLNDYFTDDVCRLYILAEEIRLKSSIVQEHKELFGCVSALLQEQLKILKQSFDTVLSRVDHRDILFLKKNKMGHPEPKILEEKVLLISALSLVGPIERVALGNFYTSYKFESGRIHANFGVTLTREADNNLDVLNHQCIVLLHVVVRIAQLCGNDKGSKVLHLKNYLKSEAFPSIASASTMGDLKKGDIVVVLSHIAEILESIDGPEPWKFKTFKIRYLPKPPADGILEEILPSWSIHKIMSRDELVKLISRRVKKIFPNRKFTRGTIERNVGSVIKAIKFSKRDSGEIHMVGSEAARQQFDHFFSGKNDMGNSVILNVFNEV